MDVLLKLNIYYPSMAYYHQGKPVFDTTCEKLIHDEGVNSLWPSDAIWHHGSGAKEIQVVT